LRYFLSLAYNGTAYCGWQRQPNGPSVQETLEKALFTILRDPIEVTGCGRTDTGVHASYYVAHFNTDKDLPGSFLNRLNSLLPQDIAIFSCEQVAGEAHARFDATVRTYAYHLSSRKDPFGRGIVWFYPQAHLLDLEKMQQTAALIKEYNAFYPFCKTHSGVDHYRCQLMEARWEYVADQHQFIFHISANRFLRGMVRLIVGACMQVGIGQLTLEDVRKALNEQTHLPKSWSVPPDGLFLTDIQYGTRAAV
jgi:tRNA pseudouridine38-40 synthase